VITIDFRTVAILIIISALIEKKRNHEGTFIRGERSVYITRYNKICKRRHRTITHVRFFQDTLYPFAIKNNKLLGTRGSKDEVNESIGTRILSSLQSAPDFIGQVIRLWCQDCTEESPLKRNHSLNKRTIANLHDLAKLDRVSFL